MPLFCLLTFFLSAMCIHVYQHPLSLSAPTALSTSLMMCDYLSTSGGSNSPFLLAPQLSTHILNSHVSSVDDKELSPPPPPPPPPPPRTPTPTPTLCLLSTTTSPSGWGTALVSPHILPLTYSHTHILNLYIHNHTSPQCTVLATDLHSHTQSLRPSFPKVLRGWGDSRRKSSHTLLKHSLCLSPVHNQKSQWIGVL